MGIEEVTLLLALQQVAQAVGALLKKASPGMVNPWAIAACDVGQQLANNIAKGAALGLVAANAEFAASNTQEKGFVAALPLIPPIT